MSSGVMYYNPYMGVHYQSGYRGGQKLLVVGESFYGGVDHTNGPAWLIGAHVCSAPIVRFCTPIEQIVTGYKLGDDERWAFWMRVAFANLIQESLGAANEQPSDDQWQIARNGFVQTLEAVQPDLVFVFSRRAWSKLPDEQELPGSHEIEGSPLLDSCPYKPESDQAYVYALKSGRQVLAGCFNHPRKLVWPQQAWHDWSNALFRLRTDMQ